MRYLFLTGGLGLALLVGLLYHYGIDDIAAAFSAAGWGVALLVVMRFAQIGGAAIAWSYLFPRTSRIGFAAYSGLRLVREGVNTLLPVAQVGGEFVGARLLAHAGLGAGAAVATVIVDLFLQAFTQALFTIAGLAVLIMLGGDMLIVREVVVGLLILVPGLLGFFLVQRLGGFGWVERRIVKIAQDRKWVGLGKLSDLNEHIQRLYRNRSAILKSALIHLLVWFFGASEIWIILTFMGQNVTLAEALVIESLSQALRSATFVVPAGLGVQEGGLIALCAVFGLPPTIALALSLSKRVAELAVGVTGLMIWQVQESRLALIRSGTLQPETGA